MFAQKMIKGKKTFIIQAKKTVRREARKKKKKNDFFPINFSHNIENENEIPLNNRISFNMKNYFVKFQITEKKLSACNHR